MEMIIEDIPENNFSSNAQSNKINNQNKKNHIDYDGILRKMGMKEVKGKLCWDKNIASSSQNFIPYEIGQRRKNINTQQQKSDTKLYNQSYQSPDYQNSYIHNKYFKNEFKQLEELQKPRNLIEYRNMLIRQIIEQKRAQQIKSRQMFFK